MVGRQTPLEFAGRQLDLKPDGRYAVVALGQPGKATWMIRRGMEALWRSTTAGGPIAMVELPTSGLGPGLSPGLSQGLYKLEAVAEKDSRMADFALKPASGAASNLAVVSFNANLAPASRLTFLGHQWLLRGKLVEARQCLQAGLSKGVTGEAEIELARANGPIGQRGRSPRTRQPRRCPSFSGPSGSPIWSANWRPAKPTHLPVLGANVAAGLDARRFVRGGWKARRSRGRRARNRRPGLTTA